MLKDIYIAFNKIIPKNKLFRNILIVILISLLLTGICWNIGIFICIMMVLAVFCSMTEYCDIFSIKSMKENINKLMNIDIMDKIISFIKNNLE